jgi:chromosome segregation ATPase
MMPPATDHLSSKPNVFSFFFNITKAKHQIVERIAKKEEDLRIAEEEVGAPGADGANKRNKVDTLIHEAQHQAEMKRQLEAELKAVLAPYKQLEREISTVKKSQSAAKSQLQRAQRELEEARSQIMAMADSAQSEEARCTSLLKDAEEALALARGKADTLTQEQSKWYRSYEEIEPHIRSATARVESHTRQLQSVQSKLRSLQSSDGNDLMALLGPRVKTVANLVRRLTCRHQ